MRRFLGRVAAGWRAARKLAKNMELATNTEETA
jgi:hypothetical protein